MSFVDLGGPIEIPKSFSKSTEYLSVINSAAIKSAYIIQIPKTGTLNKIGIITGTVTTGDNANARIETVDASNGNPTGTLYDANATGSVEVASTDDDLIKWIALNGANGISVTKGDIVAVVLSLDYVDGNLQFLQGATIAGYYFFPYTASYNGTTWSKQLVCAISLEYSTGIVYPNGASPACRVSVINLTTGSTPRIIGNRFRLPFATKAIGAWVAVDLDQNCTIVLYDSNGYTELASVTLDKDLRYGTSAGIICITFSSAIELDANTYYRIAILPSASTPNLVMQYMQLWDDGAVKAIDQLEFGEDIVYSASNSVPDAEEDWSQDTTKRAAMGIWVNEIDISAGGSAGGASVIGSSIIKAVG